ncbi:MAG: RagB/SusD family nutrient uptake outer membrane protein [Saprospirales bacterium]|nr:RagB/SusD family nutrient uptake outer membrane protein [Saprospirales bacterium]MBK8924105.1 RagB/SusD family nutrient uptake outer membrane protein [Saprospirales bacterium]
MKSNIFWLLAAFLLPLTACDKKLDLQPAQSISEDLALSTDANVKSVLLGAYDALALDGLFGGNTLRDAELLGADGEIRWVGTFNGPREVFNKAMIAGNGEAENMWLDAYKTINLCNNVLSALDVVNADDRAQVEGEARFIRAMAYFQLLRFYGKPYEAGASNTQDGVPVVLRPTRGIDESSQEPRGPVEAGYAQVVDDLTQAKGLLPEENDFRANKYAAAALLARVYLQMGNYAEARDNANDVISSDAYSLVTDYASLWNNDDNTSEDIFAIQISPQDFLESTLVVFYSIPANGGRDGDIEIEAKHLALYEAGDARLDLHYSGNGAMRTGKWRDQYKNQPIIRLAEMHLIRAECNARLGTATGAPVDDDYNATHTRAGLTAKTGVTLADILLERRVELAHEGHKIHDIKRLKGSADGFNYDANELVYPIPAREREANKNLTQNPGY